ncbi:CD63 antigen [Nasonia vitripennis]|uniref:Tetraspanin n=1 Tax=Nasonia vitripennis TaxID=7425 RepID=A0A7M7ISV7_NASVI|nr:CD63 antigen [Nasonia vitripennis]
MAATHLDLGLRCIKYLLCAVNFLFVMTGAMIVSVGTTIYAVYEDFSHFLDASYFSPATLLIVVGALVFLVAFCGCCGALKESTCMVLAFAVSLSAILLLEFSAAVATYALQDNITSLLNVKINESMHRYERNEEARTALDFLQSKLHCCGYNGAADWAGILTDANNTVDVPYSCCNWYANADGSPGSEICPAIYGQGCYRGLALIVNRSALYLMTGAMMIAIIQLAGIVFACMLGRAIRKQKTEKERRRWQLRESLLTGYEPLGKSDPFTTFPVVYMTDNDFRTQTAIS